MTRVLPSTQCLIFSDDGIMANKTMEKTPAHQLRDYASSGNLAELERLVREGVSVNDRSSFNNTALLHAAKHGKRNCLRFLIDNGADVNIVNNSGYTPLICSAIIGDYEGVKALLKAGAETWHTLKEEDGSPHRVQQTALTLAERNKHDRVAELLRVKVRRSRQRHRRVISNQNQSNLIRPGDTFDLAGSHLTNFNDVPVVPQIATLSELRVITVTYKWDKLRRTIKYEVVK